MSLFISEAWAEAAPASAQSTIASMVPLILIFVIFYFLLLRPQMKKAKEHKKMIEALAKGDEVVTSGGIVGKITRLDDSFVGIEVTAGVEIQLQRGAVTSVLPKGTIKK
ncbi:MAG: preprotein translocase subunit YajC [Gammaproteobacteria bacterium]|nr:preprotein translocase subunit YajC [Gammaproteobacteria bacterium]